MCSQRYVKKKSKEDGEKPFWISFSDLMTALMVMFLVVMAVALLAVTSPASAFEEKKKVWVEELEEMLRSDFPDIHYQRDTRTIDFGSQANFKSGTSEFDGDENAVKQKEEALRKFIPALLALANNQLGQDVVKQFVVEGYTDKRGDYLFNLNLSLQRSQRLLCILGDESGQFALTPANRKLVRDLFLVGGYSFNNEKSNDQESRRIEIRIEFLGPIDSRATPPQTNVDFGKCRLPK
jgi:outer membrane protein OmpA-like peptidoglycan-associated protein